MAERYEIELFVSFSCIFIYLFDLEKVVGRFKKKKKDVSKRSKLGGTRARSTSALTK